MREIHVPVIVDVRSDQELVDYFNAWRRTFNLTAGELGNASAQVRAILRTYDQHALAGQDSRGRAMRVARPLGLAAGLQVAAASLVTMAGKRFTVLYEAEIRHFRANKRRPQTFKFGDER